MATPASVCCMGHHWSVRGRSAVSARVATIHSKGCHLSVQAPPLVRASPATYQCGTCPFVDRRFLLQQHDLFRDRAGLAATGGSPRTESVLPFPQSGAVSHFFRARLSRRRCGSYHRLRTPRANGATPLMKPVPRSLSVVPRDTAKRTPTRDGEEVLLGKAHLQFSFCLPLRQEN
jgi:hypothetical protein